MYKIKIFILVMLLPFSLNAIASWQGPFLVGAIETGDSGLFVAQTDGSDFSGACEGKNWISLTGTTEALNRIMSVILMAQTTGKKVKYLVDGCTGANNSGYIKATRVWLDPNWP